MIGAWAIIWIALGCMAYLYFVAVGCKRDFASFIVALAVGPIAALLALDDAIWKMKLRRR